MSHKDSFECAGMGPYALVCDKMMLTCCKMRGKSTQRRSIDLTRGWQFVTGLYSILGTTRLGKLSMLVFKRKAIVSSNMKIIKVLLDLIVCVRASSTIRETAASSAEVHRSAGPIMLSQFA